MSGLDVLCNNKALQVIEEIDKAGERTMKRLCLEIEKTYKQNIRDSLNTTGTANGDLLNAATHEVDLQGMESKGTIGNSKVYSRIHEIGGVIHAKNSPYLRFQTADGGWVTVESVTIPARPTLKPAITDDPGRLGRIASEEFGKAKT